MTIKELKDTTSCKVKIVSEQEGKRLNRKQLYFGNAKYIFRQYENCEIVFLSIGAKTSTDGTDGINMETYLYIVIKTKEGQEI